MAAQPSIVDRLKSSLDEQALDGHTGTDRTWFDLDRSGGTGAGWQVLGDSAHAPGSPGFRSSSLLELADPPASGVAVGGPRGLLRVSRPEPGKKGLGSMSSTSVGEDSVSPEKWLADASLSGSRVSSAEGSRMSREDTCPEEAEASPVDAALKGAFSISSSSTSAVSALRRGTSVALIEERWLPTAARPRRDGIDIAWASTRLDGEGPVVKLDLHYQMLSSTEGIEKVEEKRRVEEVDLSSNNITAFGFTRGTQWRSLVVLNLASCMLSELRGADWPPQLKHLSVADNRLTRLGCALPKTLEILECQRNQLQSLDGVEGLRRLSRLDASHNALGSGTVGGALKSLPGLVVVDLGHNPIDCLEAGQWVHIRGLKELRVDGCLLKSLSFVPKGNALSVLSVAANRLRSLKGLPVCEHLVELYLASNRLSTVKGLARVCPNMEVLQLADNRLEEGRPVAEEFSSLKDLAELTIVGNPCSLLHSCSAQGLHRCCPGLSVLDGIALRGERRGAGRGIAGGPLVASSEHPEDRPTTAESAEVGHLQEKVQPMQSGFWDETKLDSEWTSAMQGMMDDFNATAHRLTSAAEGDLRKMAGWLAEAEGVLDKEAYLRGLQDDEEESMYEDTLEDESGLEESAGGYYSHRTE
ncbi:hypothetical protein FOZ63_016508 [Perkinsus olseni]|uniref:Uncharacterized protein n=1 Tax=Perkinsus olseni TaxID=32597 RepID=A0A7J6U268_PEROL|nr:hypothetical protein FOZ62_027875 [Perkinsus olseni]KAF4751465.1 hypothetical protein FOZ63_016508 [Perkinsus olseni]